jgi:DNA repair protein RAD50
VNHEHVCATRTFQLSNVRGKNGVVKSTFKALENMLRVKDKDGDNNSNSRRCADMDLMIPELMGVSRPILEHVIFCHQEDSNWPLGERMVLKKRFDEIFGSSRYTKALEAIEKKRKETAKEAKDKSHILDLVKKDREIAINLRVEESKLDAACIELETNIKSYTTEIDSTEKSLAILQTLESTNRSSIGRLQSLTSQMDMIKAKMGDTSDIDMSFDVTKASEEVETLSVEKASKSSLAVSIKAEFTRGLGERNEVSARLKSIRKSTSEQSNAAGLLELKANEWNDAIAAAKAAFNTDDIEALFKARQLEKQAMVSSGQSGMQSVDSSISSFQSEVNALVQKRMGCESQLAQMGEKLNRAQTDLTRIISELGEHHADRSVVETELITEITRVDTELEKIRDEKSACNSSLGRAKSILVNILREKCRDIDVPTNLSDDEFLSVAPGTIKTLLTDKPVSQNTEAIWNAKSASKIYSNLKQKSAQSGQCQFCKSAIPDLGKFESSINKHLEKLPGIIAELEQKQNPDFSRDKFSQLLGQFELVSQFCAQIDSGDQSQRLAQLDASERDLVGQRHSLVVKSRRLDGLYSDKLFVENIISESNPAAVQLEITECIARIDQLASDLAAAQIAKQTASSELQNQVAEIDSELGRMAASVHMISQTRAQLVHLQAKTGTGVSDAFTEIAELEHRETELNTLTGRLMDELGMIETRVEEISIRISLLSNQIEFRRVSDELVDARSATNNCPPDIHSQIERMSKSLQTARETRSQLSGQSGQIKVQLNDIRTKLANYIDIDEKYRQSLIQFETLNLVAKDIARYHQALDRALMQYHVTKMNEINFQLRELWERVYKGTDIDFIAIRSDTEEEQGESSTARRSYNYRVVMAKNDVELEMRGRCSAGQKVLASLIIRLVLAESFSVSCGILALDEPTTNLDRANIAGLAQALSELIESRRTERNFQLVIITHDESFVRMLGRLHACDSYYRVSKDDGGHSTIRRAAIYELNA